MNAAISTSQLVRTFGDHTAVDGVDLQVPAGEIYGFLGPNGAGKSTCVKMLCTLLRPSSGAARVAGYDITTDATEVRLRIGVALQDAALDPKLTGRELLMLQGRIYGLSHRQSTMRIESLSGLLEMAAIDNRVLQAPHAERSDRSSR
jgi:ABC-2 type transport system ATP-binding protein